MTQYRNREPDEKATEKLELIHCDLAGPIDPPAREGFKYAITFVDDYSGVIMVYFLKHKSDTVAATERFLADSAPYGHDKKIRTDNGTEFTSAEFRSLLVKNCIKHEFSAPYSPHQNGTAERSWRTLFEMARCMLLGAKLPKKLWKYALRTAAYIRNRCYNPRTGKTPFEIMTGEKPNLKNMKIFGSLCYAYVQEKKKLDARCERGVFVGYDNQSPAYLVYLPEQDNLKRVRCVKFSQEQGVTNDAVEEYARPVPETEDKHSEEDEEDHNIKEERGENQDTKQERVSKEGREERRYPERLRTKPGHLEDYILDDDDEISAAKYSVDYCYRVADIPRTYEEAVSSPEHQLWYGAMKEEVNALNENDTYELVPLPEGKTVIGGKWVYAVKLGPNNTEKHKARYVAKGYSQVKDVDYGETFSPTARHTSIRMLMQLATQEGMKVHQMDVKTAYLNADIEYEIYLEQPEGFVKKNEKGEHLVCKLKKSLYGLKQSGRNWNSTLQKFLNDQKFNQSAAENCLYTKFEGDNVTMILVWVDDIIIAASNDGALQVIKKALKDRFKMKDLGQLSWYLGIEFTFNPDGSTGEVQRTDEVLRVTVSS
ncbi:hypothetical protein Pcinc_020808 [Petrolisthes cinctipes]|uniref:Integrase catalytic domain-containing protein n=1 Tax=Petrolisthes cinctipes TaxID=88211 RepID=A0AAE1FIP4_PETCI|nr:hypothetical protein Pcinc_020808 [Petrolisthes cinctipes]